MLRNACNTSKASKADINILKSILFTQELDEVLAGTKWDPKWMKQYWHMPAIKVWAKILLRFEGLNNTASTNLIFDLGELMSLATGKDTKSVREIMVRTDKLLTPLSENFLNIKSFVVFLVACMGAEVIHKSILCIVFVL